MDHTTERKPEQQPQTTSRANRPAVTTARTLRLYRHDDSIYMQVVNGPNNDWFRAASVAPNTQTVGTLPRITASDQNRTSWTQPVACDGAI